MGTQINQVVDNLAAKLGVVANEVFSILETQATTEIVKSIFSILWYLVLIFICFAYVHKVFIKKNANGHTIIGECLEDDSPLIIVHALITAVAACLAFFSALCIIDCMQNIIQCIINPRYWALKQILDVLKGTPAS